VAQQIHAYKLQHDLLGPHMTFSIVARDPLSGAVGVACATGGPVVGALVPHARAGVGAIATQGNTNPLYGFDGLDLLARGGESAPTVLDRLLATDAGRGRRQCIIIDREGSTAAWTGPDCGVHAGTLTGTEVAVAGNMLTGTDVLEAMLTAFGETSGELGDRLLAAMLAGEAAGGDHRGVRSAALKVCTSEPYPTLDLRADWSTTPLADLAAVLEAVRAPGYAEFFNSIPTRAEPDRG
jgi:uncharacterized Ntn-hydrolase superfamily protein